MCEFLALTWNFHVSYMTALKKVVWCRHCVVQQLGCLFFSNLDNHPCSNPESKLKWCVKSILKHRWEQHYYKIKFHTENTLIITCLYDSSSAACQQQIWSPWKSLDHDSSNIDVTCSCYHKWLCEELKCKYIPFKNKGDLMWGRLVFH